MFVLIFFIFVALYLSTLNKMLAVFIVQCYAQNGIAMESHLAICLSVTLRYWHSSLAADPNIMDLLQWELPKILARIGIG